MVTDLSGNKMRILFWSWIYLLLRTFILQIPASFTFGLSFDVVSILSILARPRRATRTCVPLRICIQVCQVRNNDDEWWWLRPCWWVMVYISTITFFCGPTRAEEFVSRFSIMAPSLSILRIFRIGRLLRFVEAGDTKLCFFIYLLLFCFWKILFIVCILYAIKWYYL